MGKRWRKYGIGDYTLQQLNGQACAVWREDGRRRRFRLGRTESEGQARSLLAAFVASRATLRARQATTVAEVYAAYRSDRIKDGKLARNIDEQWRPLAPVFGTLPPDAITADLCRTYAQQRLDAGLSQGSIWTELTRLRSCLNWAAKRRVIPFSPIVEYGPQPTTRTKFPSLC